MSDFMDHFDRFFKPKLGMRADSFRGLMAEAVSRTVWNIVEVGGLRVPNNWEGDGQSTVIFNEYCKQVGGKLTTIDSDPQAALLTKKLCDQAHVLECDSVVAINKMKEVIDLLYLDGGLDPSSTLMEFTAARPLLIKGSIVMVDDSPTCNVRNHVHGKGEMLDEFMVRTGNKPFIRDYQIAWIIK